MIDGIIKADGTSRLMRAELPATYEEFRAQCHAGAQPLDVLFNSAGWSQLPTFLNKANLLKDTTASLFGLDANAVPDEVLALIPEQINEKARTATGSYKGTGNYGAGNPNSLTFDFTPKIVLLWGDAQWDEYIGTAVKGNRVTPVSIYTWGSSGFYASSFTYDHTTTNTDINLLYGYNIVSVNGNTMSWYNNAEADVQLNRSDTSNDYRRVVFTYKYLALS